MLETLRRTIGRVLPTGRLSWLSIAERKRDRSGRPAGDPGIEAVVDAGLAWLAHAQDHSTSADGGVARSFGSWSCLTGTVQIAHCWLLLFRETGDERYREAAFAANRYVRRTIRMTGPDELRGGVKGSFPVDGAYGRFEMLSWGCKFSIDSNLLEQSVRRGSNQTRLEGSARGAAPPRD